jgi:hypothetical protein
MRATPRATLGILCLFSPDLYEEGKPAAPTQTLVFGFSYALGGMGLMSVLAPGVAVGIRLARD